MPKMPNHATPTEGKGHVMVYGVLILFGLFLWFVFTSRVFRKSILGIIALVIVVGGIWILSDNFSSNPRNAETTPRVGSDRPTELISVDELSLGNVNLSKSNSGSDYYRISGTVQNNSKFATLLSFHIEITATKCWNDRSCAIVARNTVRVAVEVPPDQRTPFESDFVRLAGLPENPNWDWSISSTYAMRP
jgi:hypothetical protein